MALLANANKHRMSVSQQRLHLYQGLQTHASLINCQRSKLLGWDSAG
jgi:hypothetical protein